MLHTNGEAQHTTHRIRNTQYATRTTSDLRSAHVSRILLLLILLVALFLRVYRLSEVPAGVDYDEAGNFILAGEIAAGQSRPIFIRAYAGREAVFYWLAAGTMRLLGRSLFAFRLAAALCGVGSVLLAYLLAREMFHDDDIDGRDGVLPSLGGSTPPLLPLLTAALMAVSYWQVHVSRYGFRVNAMVLLLTATMHWLWRGLRRDNWWDLILAGVLCGLAANTYLAVRAFPLVLIVFAGWVIGTWKTSNVSQPKVGRQTSNLKPGTLDVNGWRWRRLIQFTVFGLAALVAFAPLGVFFLRNPEYFSTRMGQTSVFDPEMHGGDLWGTLGRVTLDALGIFTVRGDSNPVYNYAQKPIYGPVLGACFYVGLLVCLWRLLRRGGDLEARSLRARTPYLLLLVWLPVMLVPNVLGARGVPHSLRSMGMVPAVYVVAGLGVLAVLRVACEVAGRLCHSERSEESLATNQEPSFFPARRFFASLRMTARQAVAALRMTVRGVFDSCGSCQKLGFWSWVFPALILVLLGFGGIQTYHRYFDLWAHDAGAYYGTAADVRHAAEYLGGWDADQVTLYVSNDTYRHTTIAAFATNYDQLKWINDATLVLPVGSERPALYVFDHTNPLDSLLARYLPAATLEHRELGPDGKTGFEAYLVPPEQMPAPQPQVPGQGNRSASDEASARSRRSLGNVLVFLGHDLNAPAVSGDTLDVTLYWRVLATVDRDDWTFFAHLVDDRGFRWGGETFFNYPSSQWAPGEVILFRKRIAIAPGAPPGAYTLDMGVFSPSLDARLPALNEAGQLAGTTVRAGPFDVARAPAPPEELPPIQQPLEARFGKALAFLGSDRDRSDLRPGETLALSLYWLLEAETNEPYAVALWLEGEGGRKPLWESDPVQGGYPFERWQSPEFVRDRYALRIPRDIQAGDYDLRLAILDRDKRMTQVVPTAVGPTNDDVARSNADQVGLSRSLSLGTIHIHASDRLWEPPTFEHAVGARLGDGVELLGYDLDLPVGGTVRPGDTLHLTLIWRCLREMEVGYTVFTHLLDEGGQIGGQQDNPPMGGRYPTTLWALGEVIVDPYAIVVQPDAPPGRTSPSATYVIEVGMYDPATMQRLPVLDPTGAVGDRVLLGNVEMGK